MDDHVNRFQIAMQLLKRNIESGVQNTFESPVTKPQTFMLYALNKFGQCKVSQLAEMMEVKPSAITVMIDRLEGGGYVKRTHGTVDRRSVLVEMTPLGKDVLKKAIRQRNEILKTYLSRLEQEEVRVITELLEKMVDSDK
ncbi:MarR family winged helix-turn-helix transcriptional regulator [Lederbergia citrea]|uniref:MarR family transcriptional regulator n=1 Tax=Lederbergia citrea TaxID=2833581 RepID=A0A942Z4J5_9BACI|nr:MarR family transcriptional regulator [Lederbergia citrea]MBS4223709.1 MarR family transcriptional regulator [Lederbergia citrea]